MKQSNCETCSNFVYDFETGEYCCDIDLDEDEMFGFLSGHTANCPYYDFGDEYKIVRKQN